MHSPNRKTSPHFILNKDGSLKMKPRDISKVKTFTLSHEAQDCLKMLSDRFNRESYMNLSTSKIIELLIFHCKDKTLSQLFE